MGLEQYKGDMEMCCRCSTCKFVPMQRVGGLGSVLGAVVAALGMSPTAAPTTLAVLMLLPLSAFEAITCGKGNSHK